MTTRRTVGILVIGNEILRGRTLDTNSNYLARKAYTYGLSVQEVTVIPDEPERIIEQVRGMCGKYDMVFTSGGIGPTHDDMTYTSIAKAFDLQLRYDEETLRQMKTAMLRRCSPDAPHRADEEAQLDEDFELNEARRRMALLPSPHVVHRTAGLWVPLVILHDQVFILPGVPSLFRAMLDSYFSTHLQPVSPLTRLEVYTCSYEGDISQQLAETQRLFAGRDVLIGSYPSIGTPTYNVKVSIEGPDAEAVHQCHQHLASIVSLCDVSQ